MTDTPDQEQPSATPEDDDSGPDVAMQIFGLLVALALVFIAGTFVYDSLKDIL